MAINWKTYAGLTPAGCLPCGSPAPTPVACACALLIGKDNPFTVPATPYDSYSDAAAAIAAYVGDCYAFIDSFGGAVTVNSVTADVSVANEITVTGDEDTNGVTLWVSISVDTGATLTIPWSGTFATAPIGFSGGFADLYDCSSGSLVASDTDFFVTSGTLVLTGFPAGVYYLKVYTNSLAGLPLNATASFRITSNVSMVANPVIALWDDSGTTRQLEACPKMLIPPLTESTGTWYADATEAASAISGSVSNCVGYIEEAHGGGSGFFTATDGGTDLRLNGNGDGSSTPTLNQWGSINLGSGDVLTVTFTDGMGPFPGSVSTTFDLYDYTGTLVQTIGPGASPLAFSAAPYEGRYIVHTSSVASGVGVTYAACNALFTSSGTLSVNQIQALYDVGLTCPARDDC